MGLHFHGYGEICRRGKKTAMITRVEYYERSKTCRIGSRFGHSVQFKKIGQRFGSRHRRDIDPGWALILNLSIEQEGLLWLVISTGRRNTVVMGIGCGKNPNSARLTLNHASRSRIAH
jgi:hypothetical protein